LQRKRLQLFFDYEHRFEAYLPPQRRVLGYFACPVLAGDRIVAALDLKTDRVARRLRVQKWTWMVKRPPRTLRAAIDSALHSFERFQLAQ
ncbi:MAG TPA: crosslink repair DNA glycosylase YcaQ family protein, partial [Steroidobacteraceae bacterium]